MGKFRVTEKAIAELEEKYPEGVDAEILVPIFNIADSMAREITYVNDETGPSGETPEQRYERVLAWVRENIVKSGT